MINYEVQETLRAAAGARRHSAECNTLARGASTTLSHMALAATGPGDRGVVGILRIRIRC